MSDSPLLLNDLVLMTQVISATLQRGALRPEEMKQVGTLWEKLNKVISEASKQTHKLEVIEEEKE